MFELQQKGVLLHDIDSYPYASLQNNWGGMILRMSQIGSWAHDFVDLGARAGIMLISDPSIIYTVKQAPRRTLMKTVFTAERMTPEVRNVKDIINEKNSHLILEDAADFQYLLFEALKKAASVL